jgi:hypothetical protein
MDLNVHGARDVCLLPIHFPGRSLSLSLSLSLHLNPFRTIFICRPTNGFPPLCAKLTSTREMPLREPMPMPMQMPKGSRLRPRPIIPVNKRFVSGRIFVAYLALSGAALELPFYLIQSSRNSKYACRGERMEKRASLNHTLISANACGSRHLARVIYHLESQLAASAFQPFFQSKGIYLRFKRFLYI